MFNFLRKNKNKKDNQESQEPLDPTLEQNEDSPKESSATVTNSTENRTEIDLTSSNQTTHISESIQPEQNNPLSINQDKKPAKGTDSIDSPKQEGEPLNVPREESTSTTKSGSQVAEPKTEVQTESNKKPSFFTRLKQGLSKTRHSFTDSIASLVLGKKEIDDELLEELEMVLLTADVGIDATDRIISNLTQQISRKELKNPEALITALKTQLQEIIDPMSRTLDVDDHLTNNGGPFVILMVGINGVGKTTTIGKLAKKYQLEGKSVMLAAGDTFRAAAVEQLQTWGERNNVPVIAQKTGADSAAVIFDAVQSAKSKNIDILIADTAGRLHTQSNLMEELKKVKRVIAKVDQTAPHEVMLVIDAGTGQNALNQAKQFAEAVNVSGITLTKLDGTAKGGIVYALAEQQQIPIRFIGVGESIDDLREFDSKDFTEALFDQSKTN